LVRRRSGWPEPDDLVICTISKVFAQGAFAKLDEYEDREGMIHISEVASGWVKNIRNHVREGQKVVCKVLDVNKRKGHIDLSIRRVKSSQRRWKTQQWKRERKAEKLLERAAQRLGKNLDAAYEEVGYRLQEKFGDLYSAFEEVAVKGERVLTSAGIDEKWSGVITEIARANVEPPLVEVTGYVDLKCPTSNGVEVIRDALIKARDMEKNSGVKVEVQYIGSPRYSIRVVAPSYKIAEGILRKAAEVAIAAVEREKGWGGFHPGGK